MRHPSSYTPLKSWKENGPRSLIMGMDHGENKKQIAQFSKKDAEKFGDYEAMLEKMVAAVDPLLDHAPPDLRQNIFQKVKSGLPLLEAAKQLGTIHKLCILVFLNNFSRLGPRCPVISKLLISACNDFLVGTS